MRNCNGIILRESSRFSLVSFFILKAFHNICWLVYFHNNIWNGGHIPANTNLNTSHTRLDTQPNHINNTLIQTSKYSAYMFEQMHPLPSVFIYKKVQGRECVCAFVSVAEVVPGIVY